MWRKEMITIPLWTPFVFLLSVMVFLALTLLWLCVLENRNLSARKKLQEIVEKGKPENEIESVGGIEKHKEIKIKFNCPPIGTDAWERLHPLSEATKEYSEHLEKIRENQKRPNRDGIGSM
jgi:hypothetical protein